MIKNMLPSGIAGLRLSASLIGALATVSVVISFWYCQEVGAADISLTSTSFKSNEAIAPRYVAISPSLQWVGAPRETRTFAIVCHDPDAPNGHFVHWLAYDIPASRSSLAEGEGAANARAFNQGINGFDKLGWNGPAPPPGKVHHYVFTIYALDSSLNCRQPREQQLRNSMAGHIIGTGQLVGTYQR